MVVVNLSDVYEEMETRLKASVSGLKFPPIEAETLTPPGVMWSLPEEREYLGTYNGGLETVPVEMTICISKNAMRAATRSALQYTDPSGPYSVSAALNSSPARPYSSCDDVVVISSSFAYIEVGGTEYLGCVFKIQISGSGG